MKDIVLWTMVFIVVALWRGWITVGLQIEDGSFTVNGLRCVDDGEIVCILTVSLAPEPPEPDPSAPRD
jgi:hypothetical protein